MNILLNHSPSVAMPSNLLTYKKKERKVVTLKFSTDLHVILTNTNLLSTLFIQNTVCKCTKRHVNNGGVGPLNKS